MIDNIGKSKTAPTEDRMTTTTDPGTPGPPTTGTIYDIARVAGVSHASVSRYMRGLDMRPSTKQKIEAALTTIRYRPNLSARALISGRSMRIGALTHEVSQVGPNRIIQAATSAARDAGYLLDVVTLDMADPAELQDALQLLTRHDLAGLLAFASTDGVREVFEHTDFGVPVVIAAEEEADGATLAASGHGVVELVDHLVELGHEEFVHIAGPAAWSAARNRLRAVVAALERHGLPPARILHGDWSARSGFEAIAALERLPTAILAANDQMALGALHALDARGASVPGDVSVTGVDDTPEAAYFTPGLTTLRLDFEAQGREALQALLDRIEDPAAADRAGAPRPSLVVRASTGPAR